VHCPMSSTSKCFRMVRAVLCLLLCVCLFTPSFGAVETPPAEGRLPGAGAGTRPDPCAQPGTGVSAATRVVPGGDYRLGPGDFLEFQTTGRVEATRQQVVVDPEGVVNMPPIGAIPVIGLTLLEAQRRITERARVLFRYVDLTIAMIAPRCFEITLSGEVER